MTSMVYCGKDFSIWDLGDYINFVGEGGGVNFGILQYGKFLDV